VPEEDGILTDASGQRQQALSMLATLGALQALTLAMQALRGKMAAVLLGPAGVGVLGVIEPLVQLVAHLSCFGLPLAAMRFLSRAHSEGGAAFLAAYTRFARAVLLLAVTGTAIALAVAFVWPHALGPDLWRYRALVVVGLMGAPLLAFRDLLTSALAAVRATRRSASVGLAMALAAGLGGGTGILVGGGLLGFLVGTLAGEGIVLGIVGTRLRRAVPASVERSSADGASDEEREIAATSLILWAAYASYPLTHFLARHLVLAQFGAAQAGELEAGMELSGIVALLLGPSTALYLAPAVNRRARVSEKGRAALHFLAALAPAVALLSVPALLFPRLCLHIFYSAAFEGAAAFLVLLVAGQALRVLAGVFHALLIGLGDVRVYGLLVAIGQLSFGGLAYAWGPADGPAGVARAFLVSNTLLFALTAGRVWHLLARAGQSAEPAAVAA
jgi:O-antigen/teichoic acid export membrane protein